MTVASTDADAGKAAEVDPDVIVRPTRSSKQAYEKPQNCADLAGTSSARPARNVIEASIRELTKPLDVIADPALAKQQLEEERLRVLQEAKEEAQI